VCLFIVHIECVANDPVCQAWRFEARAALELAMRREHVMGLSSMRFRLMLLGSGVRLLGSGVSGLSIVCRGICV
jgi:hypothetical protein